MTDVKMWGKDPFWGLGYEFDPQWLLTDEQKKLQKTLIDLCQTSMRENAVESDKKLIYPRKNFQSLAKAGFLGLIVPKELGGMGENHTAAAMVVETIARYGCASTAIAAATWFWPMPPSSFGTMRPRKPCLARAWKFLRG